MPSRPRSACCPACARSTVRDGWGGIDLTQSVFGDFTFLERLFAADRDLASPYFVSVLVAPTEAAIWEGPNGLRASVENAIRDVRPIGVFPDVVEADQVFLGVRADIVTTGLALPAGSAASTDSSPAALALKGRLLDRLHRVVDSLRMAEPVRCAGDHGGADGRARRHRRGQPAAGPVPAGCSTGSAARWTATTAAGARPRREPCRSAPDQIAVLVDAPDLLTVR